MSDNFYSPPKTNVVGKPPEYRGSPVRAIGLCTLLDIGVTFIMSVVFIVVYGNYLYSQGISEQEIGEILQTINYTSPLGMLIVVIGFAISIWTGYLCAKMTNYHEYAHGLLLGIIVVICGGLINWLGGSASPLSTLETVTFSLANIIVVIIGSHLYVRSKTKPVA